MGIELTSLSERDAPFPLNHGRGDEFHHGTRADPRDVAVAKAATRLNVKARNFQ